MDRININGSTSYDVIIEHNILDKCGDLLREELAGSKSLIVTDSNVAVLYLGKVSDSLRQAGYETSSIVLSAGEETKNVDNYTFLLNVLSEREFSSTDLIIALGGGVIGDLVGFVAATFKRGTKFVQIPTTLLAAVDSSIGGKTAINLINGKNQVGIIRNPSIVICDPSVIATLSDSALHEAYAEIIKYGVLSGSEIINSLRRSISDGDYSDVIFRSVSIKKDIVEMDESDQDLRQYLNLGHLIGHAIEASSDYTIPHGYAIAEGLFYESKCCALAGYCKMNSHLAISDILREFGFDNFKRYSYDDLAPFLVQDKRIRDNSISIIVPESIGSCRMQSIDFSNLEAFIRLGL